MTHFNFGCFSANSGPKIYFQSKFGYGLVQYKFSFYFLALMEAEVVLELWISLLQVPQIAKNSSLIEEAVVFFSVFNT
jgi:hypothetical protein